MANTAGTVTVVEDCRVSPPPNHFLPQEILPLTYLDIIWLTWPSVSRVYFYEFPCSATEFTQTLVPQLKKSLASTLKHYYPFCGNLITPTTLSNTTTPAIRCLKGDSLSLTIAEFSGTSNSFQHLSGNHARHADELYALVPQLPPKSNDTIEGDSVLISPLLSVQVTLFPDQGFSVGFRNSHVVADGKSMSNFIRTWAAINAKQPIGDVHHIDNLDTLPFYDRSVINDPMGLGSMIYREISRMGQENSNGFVPEDDKKDLIQVTLGVNQVQIQALKNLVPAQLQPVSTFAVVCSYVWTCMAKTRAALGQELSGENEVEHFIFAMDIRARLNPPIPSNYFGNAIIGGWATVQTSQITRDEGFVKAVGEIKKTIQEITNDENGVSKGLAKLFNLVAATKGHTKFGVAGSPKFDYYSTDFGWGKPIKYEVVAEKFALSGSRDREGDLELGFCYSKSEMDVFTTIFTQGLSNY